MNEKKRREEEKRRSQEKRIENTSTRMFPRSSQRRGRKEKMIQPRHASMLKTGKSSSAARSNDFVYREISELRLL
jgi:hypothetical protein